MNALTAFLSTLTCRSSALIFGCASVGLLGGLIGGTVQYSRQKPVFESYAVLYPSSVSLSGSVKDWIEEEAAAILQRKNLENAALRSNLVATRHMTEAECAGILESAVSVSIRDSSSSCRNSLSDRSDTIRDAPGYPVLSIVMQGPDPAECAAVVSALIAQREDAWLAAERRRLANDPVSKSWIAKSAEATQLLDRSKKLRTELVAGLPAAGIQNPDISDNRLASLQLTGILRQHQNEWNETRVAWERSAQELSSQPMQLRPYAEVLQKPKAAVSPVGPEWGHYGWSWLACGLGAGLFAGLIFRQLKVWNGVEGSTPVFSPAVAAEF